MIDFTDGDTVDFDMKWVFSYAWGLGEARFAQSIDCAYLYVCLLLRICDLIFVVCIQVCTCVSVLFSLLFCVKSW